MRVSRRCAVALVATLIAGLAQAATDAVAHAKAMLAAGHAATAISTLDVYLAANPKDIEARFTRGVALAKAQRNAEAITAFTQLAADLPNVAEPYNNLASVYAAQGDYVKAHSALENALARNPNSVSARINLGDVYMALAEVEYQKAVKLDGTSTLAKSKLAALEGKQPEKVVVAQAAPASPPVRVEPPKAEVAKAPVAKLSPQAKAVVTKTAPANAVRVDEKSLAAFLQTWSSSWANGEVDRYLSLYDAKFEPSYHVTRADWTKARTRMLSERKNKKVTLRDIQWKALRDHVAVSFSLELGTEGQPPSVVPASLELVQTPEKAWRIVRESVRSS